MKKITLVLSIFIGLTISCFGQIDESLSYEELETKAISSFRNNNIDSSIILMESALKNFPEELGRSTYLLAQLYTRVGNLSKAIKTWEIGINKGYSYDLNNEVYQKYYKDNVDFERLAKIEKSRMDTSHLKHEVILPTDYSTERTYPVLFIFHGNNRNIVKSKVSWNAPIMESEFISVFLQSYIPSSPTNFKWVPKDEKIKKEFTEIYNQVLNDYPVDEAKIIFAGMSAGGKKALDFTLNNYFPVSGLVLNCPVVPQNVTDEMIKQFVEKNKKIGIITGENDFALAGQKTLVNKIDSLSGQTKMFVTKDLGHSFAENFTELLDEYLSWVIKTEQHFLETKDAYFGQNPPGDSAVIFAPGIVSVDGRYEYGVSFTPDLEEIYFTGKRKGESTSVYFSKLEDGKWTNPKKANLTKGEKKAEFEAFVNHSGNKIYFTANDSRDIKIWCATRSENGWSNAIQLDSPINDDMVFYPNAAKNGDLFYKNVSKGKMYYATNKDGKFPEIHEVGIEYGSHGFIAPSQDFMLIDALKENDKTKDKDIHICFKKKDGTWTKPINLGGDVNSNFNETCPSITPDGKYMFFSRFDEEGGLPNIYWVSSKIIDDLEDEVFNPTNKQD